MFYLLKGDYRQVVMYLACRLQARSYESSGPSVWTLLTAQGRQFYYLGGCQKCGPFLGPYYNTGPNTGPNLGDPKRDHNFDNPPFA